MLYFRLTESVSGDLIKCIFRILLQLILARDEKLDLLHFWHESKVKSNMVLALTIVNNFDFSFDARQRWSQMNQCFAIPLTLIKVVVKYAGNLIDFTFDARQRWSQKCSGWK